MGGPRRIEIGSWPTPVRRLDEVSRHLRAEVWTKSEEHCGAWGGNKVRKLEYILGRARADGVGRLVGYGAGTSNWTSALALHASAHGFEVTVRVTANEVPTAYGDLYRRLGTTVEKLSTPRWLAEVAQGRLRPDRRGTRYLVPGGSDPDGNLGSLRVGIEVADAIRSGEIPRPRNIVAAAGTGGTCAGLAAGTAAAGLRVPIVCVRAVGWPYGTVRVVRSAMRSILRDLQVREVTAALIEDDRFYRPGYARPNRASLEATSLARLDGLELDPTYAAKAFASLVASARAGRPGPYLFVDTSPGPPPAP